MYHNVSDLVHAEPVVAAAEAAAIAEMMKEAAAEEAPAEEVTEAVEEAEVAEEAQVVAPFTELEQGELEESVPAPRRRAIKIETIEGIGPVYSAKLGEIGILTTEDLLTAGATRKGRQVLVEKTDISDKLILRWVNMADLMRVPGVGEEYSELLEAAGVDTVKELRNRNVNNLYNAMIVVNNEKNLVRRAPHLTEVESWVLAAKEMDIRMSY
jgi:predicted flap endonuclease-1-like 5' DNA nuclease